MKTPSNRCVQTTAAAWVAAGLGTVFAQPPLPTEVPADLRVIPFRIVQPESGYRFAGLTRGERNALRREVRLPMETLGRVGSLAELRSAVEAAPLPDPSVPLLPRAPRGSPAAASGEAGDPFTGARDTSFRDDPMAALGALLAASLGAPAAGDAGGFEPSVAGGEAIAPPAPEAGGDPFEADPFEAAPADDADPFAGEDPFDF